MKKNKHIVIVTTNFANGGTERRAMVLANGLASKGYKVTYLVTNKIYTDVVYKLDDSIELLSVSGFAASDTASAEKAISQKHIKKKLKLLNFMHRVAKKLKIKTPFVNRKKKVLTRIAALRAFIICNQGATFVPFGIGNYESVFFAAEGLKCKLLFSEINVPSFVNDPNEQVVFESVYSHILKKANACIFQTEEQKSYYGNCVCKNGYIIKNPITTSLPPFYTGERKHVVVNFCRTHPQKNLLLLIDAFKLFSEKHDNYILEIYGYTSTEIARNYKVEILKRISDLELENKIFIYDAVPDVHKRIFDYAMFVSSSDYEGLSNSMIEAMALGLPCICTDCEGGGSREVITDGENGLIVPVRDAEAMCEAMCKIAQDSLLAEKIGRKASQIRDELSVENIVNKWIEVITSI